MSQVTKYATLYPDTYLLLFFLIPVKIKWVWLCTFLAVVVSVCIAKDTQELSFWSERFVPGVNLTITALIPPILWLTAKRKHLLDT